MDFVTGLPPSERHQVVLTVVDRFSKSAHFIPLLKLLGAAETVELLVQHVFRFNGSFLFCTGSFGQPCIGIPPRGQRAGGENKPEPGGRLEVCGSSKHILLEHLPAMGGEHPQFLDLYFHWFVSLHGFPGLPACVV